MAMRLNYPGVELASAVAAFTPDVSASSPDVAALNPDAAASTTDVAALNPDISTEAAAGAEFHPATEIATSETLELNYM